MSDAAPAEPRYNPNMPGQFLTVEDAALYVRQTYGKALYWPYTTPPTKTMLDDAFCVDWKIDADGIGSPVTHA